MRACVGDAVQSEGCCRHRRQWGLSQLWPFTWPATAVLAM